MFYCVECKSEYSTMSNLRRHKQTQCPFGPKLTILPTMHEQRVACPDCGVTFSRRNNLARHRKMVKCTEWRDAPSQNDDYDESDETEEQMLIHPKYCKTKQLTNLAACLLNSNNSKDVLSKHCTSQFNSTVNKGNQVGASQRGKL